MIYKLIWISFVHNIDSQYITDEDLHFIGIYYTQKAHTTNGTAIRNQSTEIPERQGTIKRISPMNQCDERLENRRRAGTEVDREFQGKRA
jgi:hypothetical protein